MARVIDRFRTPILTPTQTAHHLVLPRTTLSSWIHERAAGAPLVHRVTPERRSWPSLPFVAVIEAYVLRSLRDLGLSKQQVRTAAEVVRKEFATEYGLATRRIATDGIDIFVEYADGLARATDQQRPIREVIDGYLRYIEWDDREGWPTRLRLRQYPEAAPVIIDPCFAWGAPVLADSKIPISAVIQLWTAGEELEAVAAEYGVSREVVESICRQAVAA